MPKNASTAHVTLKKNASSERVNAWARFGLEVWGLEHGERGSASL